MSILSIFTIMAALVNVQVSPAVTTNKQPPPTFGSLKLTWFEATGPSDNCTNIPTKLVEGPLDDDICSGVAPGSKKCACVSTPPSSLQDVQGNETLAPYMRMCGQCFDPCALHFHVEHNEVTTFEANNVDY